MPILTNKLNAALIHEIGFDIIATGITLVLFSAE